MRNFSKLFINQLAEEYGRQKIDKLLPDSTLWTELFDYSYSEPHKNMYHWHPSYDNYPVVNISKTAMERYCTWLTEKYHANNKREFQEVVFRLPTEKEWMLFSSPLPGHKLPWYGDYPYIVDKEGEVSRMLANIKVMDYAVDKYDYTKDGALMSCAVGAYKPNHLGIYDVIGNVAELTSDNKIKGGSWDNTLLECLIDKTQEYTAPEPRVGFRIVMEVIEK